MSNARTKRPANDTRCARRSLVELTAAASRAVDDGLFVMPAGPLAASPNDPPRSEHAAKTPDRAVVTTQPTAAIPITAPDSPNAAVSRRHEPANSDSAAEMFVKIAKDYQSRAFESFRVSLNAALDHAKAFAETRTGSEAASKDNGGAGLDNTLTVLGGVAAEFRAETLELMKANVFTSLEYAREVAGTTTAADFVKLSSTQARRQCELFMKHAVALTSLAQTTTKSNG